MDEKPKRRWSIPDPEWLSDRATAAAVNVSFFLLLAALLGLGWWGRVHSQVPLPQNAWTGNLLYDVIGLLLCSPFCVVYIYFAKVLQARRRKKHERHADGQQQSGQPVS